MLHLALSTLLNDRKVTGKNLLLKLEQNQVTYPMEGTTSLAHLIAMHEPALSLSLKCDE